MFKPKAHIQAMFICAVSKMYLVTSLYAIGFVYLCTPRGYGQPIVQILTDCHKLHWLIKKIENLIQFKKTNHPFSLLFLSLIKATSDLHHLIQSDSCPVDLHMLEIIFVIFLVTYREHQFSFYYLYPQVFCAHVLKLYSDARASDRHVHRVYGKISTRWLQNILYIYLSFRNVH